MKEQFHRGAGVARALASALIPVLALSALAGCAGHRDSGVIFASGHVEATDVRIATKVAGHLETFTLEEGDRVTVGQELARIDTTDLILALNQARADQSQAGADLRLRLAGTRKEEIAEQEAKGQGTAADF